MKIIVITSLLVFIAALLYIESIQTKSIVLAVISMFWIQCILQWIDDRKHNNSSDVIGKEAIAVSDLNPYGRVKIGNKNYMARCLDNQYLMKGDMGVVIDQKDTFIIKRKVH